MTPEEIISDALRWLTQNTPRRAAARTAFYADIDEARKRMQAGDWKGAALSALDATYRCSRQPAAMVAQLRGLL